MHSANFKTKKLMQLFMPKLVIFRVTLHAFLEYLKFQNHECISRNEVETF